MEIKIFGKSLFSYKTSKADALLESAMNPPSNASKFLPDFHKGFNRSSLSDYLTVSEAGAITAVIDRHKGTKVKKVPEPKKGLTPKEVHTLQLLNDKTFTIKTDPTYVEEQLAHFRDKLALITAEEYDMRNGQEEIRSIVCRMENRKKYAEHKVFFDQYPYTTGEKILKVTTDHDNLQLGQVAQFMADMPKEATETMKAYTEETKKLCDKLPVFYIIADKKDFKKTESRRDPILLAQSPFGHFWQILGAWDEEMLYLGDL